MSKQTINVGSAANDKKGDSLRAAFQKVNANFTELYTALGLADDTTLNLGAFAFTGSTMTTTDSSAITIDNSVTVNSNLTIGGDLLPETNLGSNLGSPTHQFKSLYVSTNTIYINNVPLSLDGSNNILVNGNPISGRSADTGDYTFESSNLFATGRVEITNGSTAEEDWNAGIQIPERNAEDDLYIRNIGVEGNNVIIQTPHGTWTYGHDGTFNLPGLSGGIGSYVQATNDITINANGAEYRFKTDGSVVFPTLTTQRGDAYNGTISGQTLLFGDANQGAIITTPDGVEGNPYSQRLIINPGQGYDYGEGGDIYLWAGRGGSNNGSGGDLKIRGGDSFGSGESGYIRIEAGQVHGSGPGGEVRIVAGPSDSGNGGSIYIAGANGGNYGGGVTINGGYSGGEAGADVVITGGGSGWGAAYYGQVKINAVSGQWTFGRDGALTLPNGAKLNNGNGYQFATDNTVTTSLDLRDTTGRGFYTGDAGFTLRSNGTYNWIFGTDGSLTFPNNTVQTTAYQTTTAPGSSKGVSGNKAGMVAFDSGNFYYCKQNYTDGVADIWVKTAWTSTSW